MYSKIPTTKNTAGKIIALCSIIAGVALFGLGSVKDIPLPALAQLLGVIFLTFGIYVVSAYLLREYLFEIKESNRHREDAPPDFVIYQKHGVRQALVCRIGFEEIDEIRKVTPENKKSVNEERKKLKRYTYDTQFAAQWFIELKNEEFSILLTYDEELFDTLKRYHEKAKNQ